jgi:hypothetical protein
MFHQVGQGNVMVSKLVLIVCSALDMAARLTCSSTDTLDAISDAGPVCTPHFDLFILSVTIVIVSTNGRTLPLLIFAVI